MGYELGEYIAMSAIQKRILPDSKLPYVLLYIFNSEKAREERRSVVNYLINRGKEPKLETEARLCRKLVSHGKNPRRVLKRFVMYSIRDRRRLNF